MSAMMTPSDVAKILKTSERYIRKLAAKGEIEAIRVGARGYRISQDALQQYIDTHKVKPKE